MIEAAHASLPRVDVPNQVRVSRGVRGADAGGFLRARADPVCSSRLSISNGLTATQDPLNYQRGAHLGSEILLSPDDARTKSHSPPAPYAERRKVS